MKCSIRKVTPALAREWLASNEARQRKILALKLTHYVEQMKEGRWMENGESIIFDKQEKLIDGQHRLRSIAMSGVTVDMVVVTDVDPNNFSSIDTGNTRTGKSIMEMYGNKNAALLAALLRLIAIYKNSHIWPGQQGSVTSRLVTNDQLTLTMEEEGDTQEICKIITKYTDSMKIMAPSLLSFLCWLVGKRNRELAIKFISLIGSGENLPCTSPIMILRKKMIESKSNMTYSTVAKWAFLAKTWNAFVNDDKKLMLRWSSAESIPDLIIPK